MEQQKGLPKIETPKRKYCVWHSAVCKLNQRCRHITADWSSMFSWSFTSLLDQAKCRKKTIIWPKRCYIWYKVADVVLNL